MNFIFTACSVSTLWNACIERYADLFQIALPLDKIGADGTNNPIGTSCVECKK